MSWLLTVFAGINLGIAFENLPEIKLINFLGAIAFIFMSMVFKE